jgi:hypothetical protein
VSDLTAPSGPALSPDSIISPKTRQMKNFESLEPKFMDGYDSDGGEAPALPARSGIVLEMSREWSRGPMKYVVRAKPTSRWVHARFRVQTA